MTTAHESKLLTQVGPGTPMGRLMREYWIPALKSSELVADGEPVRVMLLGEKLVAFRDSSGRVGLMDHRCPHRVASLFFGRNEQDGIRCVYHGWKFDVDGKCLDMPNVPAHQQFTETVHAKAYQTAERNGVIWTYMGERAVPPPMPVVEPALLGEDEMVSFVVQRECSYLQALEGDIDTSHFGFLHAGGITADDVEPDVLGRYSLINRAPEYHVADTDWGTMYAGYREAEPGTTYWRFAHFLFPFWTMPPDGPFAAHVVARAWVPMDDTHTMFFHMSWKKNAPSMRNLKDGSVIPGAEMGMKFLPNTSDWYGRGRLEANASNDYLLDRDQQRSASYSGLVGIHLQDQAVTESMGGVTDHDFEHLAISDRMINRTRQRLVMAVEAHEAGIVPPGVDNPQTFEGARSGDFLAPASVGWLQAYADEVRAADNPTGILAVKIAAE